MTAHETFGPIIASYTRAQALDDGALVDVTEMAQDARFRVPVALTRDAWAEAVAWDDDRPESQDENGRLWDVLYLAGHAASRTAGSNRVTFRVLRVPNENRGHDWNQPEPIELALHIGPGDNAEPVITIMLPNES